MYVDSRKRTEEIAIYLRRLLLAESDSYTQEEGPVGTEYLVSTIINTFTSHVAQYDKDKRYAEFKLSSSRTRIMVATTSLGMGVNIPDVARVVIWRFPIDEGLIDVWQRLGRGGRGEGRTSQAYIFLPYWAFNSECRARPKPVNHPRPVPVEIRKPRRQRNMLPSQRIRQASRLSTIVTYPLEDVSDTESVTSDASDTSQLLETPVNSSGVTVASAMLFGNFWRG